LPVKLLAVIEHDENGKHYRIPSAADIEAAEVAYSEKTSKTPMPTTYSKALAICLWGVESWEDLHSNRQYAVLSGFASEIKEVKNTFNRDNRFPKEYSSAILIYLSIILNRTAVQSTSYCAWKSSGEFIASTFTNAQINMIFDFAECQPLSNKSGSFANQIDWVIRYINNESSQPFAGVCRNASSGDITQFKPKEISSTITDPPYYDAVAYADLSDFFYMWLKKSLGDILPANFSTPRTPKSQECTALKHHHDESKVMAGSHFEKKLLDIFKTIEYQTRDIVSIMFAHQTTKAWTTLCNSIINANLNIFGSWAIDTERDVRSVSLAGAALTSSVTVACRPAAKQGFGDYNEVREEIQETIQDKVRELYALGFRGADLLTACFGQAVSVFGRYKVVEKANGDQVTVAELLGLAREMAFRSIINDVDTDEVTQFYLGWLASSGFAAADHDMVRKVTQIGLNIDTSRLDHYNILIADGNKQSLADSHQRFQANNNLGLKEDAPDIDRIHRLFRLLDNNNRPELLNFIHDNAPTTESPLWRVMNSLKELLPPDHDDGKIVATLLASQEVLLRDARERQETSTTQGQLDLK
jgi:adenine-specific DNA methylase